MKVRTEQKAGRRQWFGLAVLLPPTMLLTAALDCAARTPGEAREANMAAS
ncbi:hypothetical protein [Nonomuraea sp. NPDC001699]